MKKIFAIVIFMFMAVASWAYDVEVDGIYYNLVKDTKTAEVTSGDTEYSGIVSIPKSVVYDGITYSVNSIGKEAFEGCSSLSSVTIPNSVTNIEENAFRGCKSLTSINIPSSVNSIEYEAFAFCSNLESITVNKKNKYYDSRNKCNAIIKTSTNELFIGCKNTIIPSSVTSICGGAFYGCRNLTSLDIPSSVTDIGAYAFYGCGNLTSLDIPSSVTDIGSCAFYECRNLTSINIPSSVTRFRYAEFAYCSKLTSLTIPSSVEQLGECLLTGCSSLEYVSFPSSIKTINWAIFSSCKNLKCVVFPSEELVAPSKDFDNLDCSSITLYVPSSLVDSYKSATGWKNFGNILPIPSP